MLITIVRMPVKQVNVFNREMEKKHRMRPNTRKRIAVMIFSDFVEYIVEAPFFVV